MWIINCSWYKPKNSWFFRCDFRPWQKYLQTLSIYINKNSNHPPNILKQLPKSIAKRISETSSSEEIFNKSIKIYSKPLKESGFTDELKYSPNEVQELGNKNNRKQKRKIIWFNPPYSKNIKTSVGKIFLKLRKKHFPTSHILLHKVFNKKLVTVGWKISTLLFLLIIRTFKYQNNVVWM